MTEFICEGCGIKTVQVIADEIPAHGFCSTCAWICENVPGPEGMAAYDEIYHRKKEKAK